MMEIDQQTYQYDAFISYSRKDKAFAQKLEKALEYYQPPKDLDVPQGHLSFFRDEGDMTGTEYFQSIGEHLKSSAKLIVVCSPNARKSELVNDEIRRFVKIRNAENVIPVLLDGIPNNLAKPGQEDKLAFPEALCEIKEMPLATNFLGFRFRKDKINKDLFEDSWYTVLANIYAVSRSEIEQRDKKRQVRRRNILSGITLGIMMILLSLTAVALWQRDVALTETERAEKNEQAAQDSARVAQEQRKISQEQRDLAIIEKMRADANAEVAVEQRKIAVGRQLAAQAELTLSQEGTLLERAILLAVESVRRFPSPETNAALRHSLSLFPRPIANIEPGSIQLRVVFSPDGALFATLSRSLKGDQIPTEDHSVRLRTVRNGREVAHLRHDDSVHNLVFDHSGKRAATASKDGIAKVWEVKTAKELTRFRHGHEVYGLAFSPDGRYVASSAFDSRGVVIWDSSSGKLIRVFSKGGAFGIIRFSPDGRRLAANGGRLFGGEENIFVWDMQSGKQLANVNHKSKVRKTSIDPQMRTLSDVDMDQIFINALEFSPDGKLLASAGFDGSVRIWDCDDSRLINHMLHDDAVNSIDFTPDGEMLASGSNDNTARIWEVTTGREISRVVHEDMVEKVAFAPTGTLLGTASRDGTARLWTVPDGFEVGRVTHDDFVRDFAIGPNGRYLVTAIHDGTAWVWDLKSLSDVRRTVRGVFQMTATPDKSRMAAIDMNKAVKVWETEGGALIAYLKHSTFVRDVAISSDGGFVATRTSAPEKAARVWDVSKAQELVRFPAADAVSIRGLALSKNGRYLAVTSGGKGTRVWSTTTGEELGTFEHERRAIQLEFSPDVRYLATATVGAIAVEGRPRVNVFQNAYIWEVETGVPLANLSHQESVRGLCFSQNGKYLATGSDDNNAVVWEVPSGKKVLQILHDREVRAVDFSHDSRYVATASEDASSQVWRIEPPEQILRIHHDSAVNGVALSRNGKFLATASDDFSARVWDVESGKELARIAHRQRVRNVLFNGNGQHLISESGEKSIQSWLWPDTQLMIAACERVRRNLLDREWQRFFPNEEWRMTCPSVGK